MKRRQAIKPVTYMKTHSADLLKDVRSGPVIITQSGEAKAVIQDISDYQRTKDALVLLRILALGEADIRNGKMVEQEDVFDEIERELRS